MATFSLSIPSVMWLRLGLLVSLWQVSATSSDLQCSGTSADCERQGTTNQTTATEAAASTTATTTTLLEVQSFVNPSDCTIFMVTSAASSTGYRVFTSAPIAEGATILYPDLAIPLVDRPLHWERSKKMQGGDWSSSSYLYDAPSTFTHTEGQTIETIVGNVGTLAASHPTAANLQLVAPVSTSLLHDEPGAGASTLYVQASFIARRAIAAGEELVVAPRHGNETTNGLWLPQVRKETWLRRNAYCLEGWRTALSDVDGAGYGAFATRQYEEGQAIALVPVLPMHKQDLQTFSDTGGPFFAKGRQLMTNYVIGHAESSIVLLPLAPGVAAVNHDSAHANAYWSWSSRNADDVWTQSPRELLTPLSKDILVELHADRQIEPGEEILIDYGQAWQQAWEDYVEMWEVPEDLSPTAAWLNERLEAPRTPEELETDPYPKNVRVYCFVAGVQDPAGNIRWKEHAGLFDTIQLFFECTIESRVAETVEESVTSEGKKALKLNQRPLTRAGLASLMEQGREDEVRYNIMLRKGDQTTLMIKSVPRRAIRFVDQAYTSDLHHPDSFRHEMRGLDFPVAWLDALT